MKTVDARIEELEMQIRQLKFEIARKPAREAAPLAPRHGRFLGTTASELNGDGLTVDVTAYLWSATDAEWQETTTIIEDVRAFDDNTPIPLDTKVYVFWYETTWVLLPAGASDLVWFYLLEPLYLDDTVYLNPRNVKAMISSPGAEEPGPEIQIYDSYRYPFHILDLPTGAFNGFIGHKGCAVRLPFDYTAPGESAVWYLSLDALWWLNAGTVALDIDGDVTGAVTWPTVTPGTLNPDAASDFLANLQTEIDATIGAGNCVASLVNGYGSAPADLQLRFIGTYVNVAVPVSVDSFSHDGTGTEPTVVAQNEGSSTPVTRPAYGIIWMERMPQWIEFITTEDMSASTPGAVAVDILHFDNQGRFAPTVPVDPHASTFPVPNHEVVYDNTSTELVNARRFNDVVNDCRGYAVYDNHNNRYLIQHCQRQVMFLTGQAGMCPGDEGNPTIGTLTAHPVGEHIGGIGTSTVAAFNNLGLASLSGDAVAARRISNDLRGELGNDPIWEVINVTPHAVDLVTNIALGTVLEQTKITVYVYRCDTDDTTTTVAAITQCPSP